MYLDVFLIWQGGATTTLMRRLLRKTILARLPENVRISYESAGCSSHSCSVSIYKPFSVSLGHVKNDVVLQSSSLVFIRDRDRRWNQASWMRLRVCVVSSNTWSGYDVENLLCAYGFKIFPTSYRDHEFQRVEGMLSTAQYIWKGRGHGFNSSIYL